MKTHTVQAPKSNEVMLALALSLAAAISLGVTRFAYGLLLPPMRESLAWSYTLAGAMNTANAVGYLIGALLMPVLLRRWSAGPLVWWGAALASVWMAVGGWLDSANWMLIQRCVAGILSALVFVGGGLQAARLGERAEHQRGLLLGLYYGGVGFGIVFSSLLVPWVLGHWPALVSGRHAWQIAWVYLALICALACVILAWPTRVMAQAQVQALSSGAALSRFGSTSGSTSGWASGSQSGVAVNPSASDPRKPELATDFEWRRFAFGLAGYAGFGIGYIGYMTFVIALLRQQGWDGPSLTAFYALLGLCVVASAKIWAGLLNRHRGGGALARLNALLGVATVIPVLTTDALWMLVSGALFGAVFLSTVASTTALVRHNLVPSAWARGVSAFTIVFAVGQIVGPTMVGWIADGHGGLARGLLFSACALWLGAALAWRQKPLGQGDNAQ